MKLELGLLVTDEFAGGLIGERHAEGNAHDFAASAGQLVKLAPCDFVTAVPAPAGTAERVRFQVQNFSDIAVTIATGSLADYIDRDWRRRHIGPGQLVEVTVRRGMQVLLVPFLPPPPGFKARKAHFRLNFRVDGVLLTWGPLPGVERYRVYKHVVLTEKGATSWRPYQAWQCDVAGTEFHDSDFSLEKHADYHFDTVYSVAALHHPGFPGSPTPGITYAALQNAGDDWIGAAVPVPLDWIDVLRPTAEREETP